MNVSYKEIIALVMLTIVFSACQNKLNYGIPFNEEREKIGLMPLPLEWKRVVDGKGSIKINFFQNLKYKIVFFEPEEKVIWGFTGKVQEFKNSTLIYEIDIFNFEEEFIGLTYYFDEGIWVCSHTTVEEDIFYGDTISNCLDVLRAFGEYHPIMDFSKE